MIVGIGTDLVRVPGLAEQLADTNSAFAEVTFTRAELDYSQRASSHEPPRHLAARFAAKEATLKALDLACSQAGIKADQVSLRDIEVVLDEAGRPSLHLHGPVGLLATKVGADRAWLSLTHDGEYASAVVALERIQ